MAIEKFEDNKLPDSTNEILKTLILEIRKDRKTNNAQIAKLNDEMMNTRNQVEDLKKEFEDNKKLEKYQRETIKNEATRQVKKILDDKEYYNNISLRSTAYGKFYHNLKPFGYESMSDTKQKSYGEILKVITSGRPVITRDEVIERYNFNQYKKGMN